VGILGCINLDAKDALDIFVIDALPRAHTEGEQSLRLGAANDLHPVARRAGDQAFDAAACPALRGDVGAQQLCAGEGHLLQTLLRLRILIHDADYRTECASVQGACNAGVLLQVKIAVGERGKYQRIVAPDHPRRADAPGQLLKCGNRGLDRG